jgi:hypothetical protein
VPGRDQPCLMDAIKILPQRKMDARPRPALQPTATMTAEEDTKGDVSTPERPPIPTIGSSIKVEQLPAEHSDDEEMRSRRASTESQETRRRHKRRSANSVDLNYRYREPSDDELSWTEDEHGTRRRRKSHKRKSGGGDDFKTGIMYVH